MHSPNAAPSAPVKPLPAPRCRALQHLLEGHESAAEAGQEPWEFAAQLASLNAAGISDAVLRWLVSQGLIEHRLEITRPAHARRKFTKLANLRFQAASCFVLTPKGVQTIKQMEAPASEVLPFVPRVPATPRWDAVQRILFVGEAVVKRYRVPAENQELILNAFEEEAWPTHLDDPLPPRPDTDPCRRLHDTIKSLNRNQRDARIHFEGNGTGRGVRWRIVSA